MIPPILRSGPSFWRRLSAVAPALAGDLAYQRFCTPALSERRTPDHRILVDRARHLLRHAERQIIDTVEGPVSAYISHPDRRDASATDDGDPAASPPTVILAHGWTSEASFMTAIAEALRRGGFRVVNFDYPAHGLSNGRTTSLIACARAFIDVAEACGPVNYCVAHSMGCLATLLAARGGRAFRTAIPLEGYVLIAPPNDFRDVTRHFTDRIGLSPAACRHYERRLERVTHRPLATLTSARFLNRIERPALLIHSNDDDEVGAYNARQIAAESPWAQLKLYDGLGHRRILYASNVMRDSVRFLQSLQPDDGIPARQAAHIAQSQKPSASPSPMP